MAERAVATGSRIGVIATLPSTLEPTAGADQSPRACRGKAGRADQPGGPQAPSTRSSPETEKHDQLVGHRSPQDVEEGGCRSCWRRRRWGPVVDSDLTRGQASADPVEPPIRDGTSGGLLQSRSMRLIAIPMSRTSNAGPRRGPLTFCHAPAPMSRSLHRFVWPQPSPFRRLVRHRKVQVDLNPDNRRKDVMTPDRQNWRIPQSAARASQKFGEVTVTLRQTAGSASRRSGPTAAGNTGSIPARRWPATASPPARAPRSRWCSAACHRGSTRS